MLYIIMKISYIYIFKGWNVKYNNGIMVEMWKIKLKANDDNPFWQSTKMRLWRDTCVSNYLTWYFMNKTHYKPSIDWAIPRISLNYTGFLSTRVLNSDTRKQHPWGLPFLISPWNIKMSEMRDPRNMPIFCQFYGKIKNCVTSCHWME